MDGAVLSAKARGTVASRGQRKLRGGSVLPLPPCRSFPFDNGGQDATVIGEDKVELDSGKFGWPPVLLTSTVIRGALGTARPCLAAGPSAREWRETMAVPLPPTCLGKCPSDLAG